MRIPLATLALITLTACAPSPAPDTRAADEAAIRQLDEQWSAAAAKLDLDATVSYYAPDAVLLPPNAPIATTPKAIRDNWAGMLLPGVNVTWKATKIEAAKSGDIAYLYGTYNITGKDPKSGEAFQEIGKILEVWKKQADGKWKCAVDTFNSDAPAK